MNKLKYISPILIALACFGFQQAKADSFSFFLDTPNTAITPYPAPYISVTVDRTSTTTATITYDSWTTGGYTYLLMDGGVAAVNANASSSTIGNISSVTASGFVPQPVGDPHDGGAHNESTFGFFNHTIDAFDGTDHAMSQLTFTLTGGVGTDWLTAGEVLTTLGQGGFMAAAHVVVFSSDNVVNGQQLTTGYVAGNGLDINLHGPGVPDGGATVMLLGTALGVLGMARRFLKS